MTKNLPTKEETDAAAKYLRTIMEDCISGAYLIGDSSEYGVLLNLMTHLGYEVGMKVSSPAPDRVVAWGRNEEDPCEALTPGCSINHSAEDGAGTCETW